MDHTFRISDTVGVPSTLGAIMLNIMQVLNFSNVSMAFTIIISLLSIAYLIMGIWIRSKEIKKQKNSSNDSVF
jgi:glucose uptake protein GlcU